MKNGTKDKQFIGYAAFDYFHQAYLYNEDACYIADSRASLEELIENAKLMIAGHRVDQVKFSDLRQDFGVSCGQFALETSALKRFELMARKTALKYSVQPYDNPFEEEPGLFVVQIDRKQDTIACP
jgi:hypothetical protein